LGNSIVIFELATGENGVKPGKNFVPAILFLCVSSSLSPAFAEYEEAKHESMSLAYQAGKLLHAKNFSAAEPLLRRAVALDSSNQNAQYNLGWCLHQQNKFREALDPTKRAAELDPNDAGVRSMLAKCYRDLQDYRSATYVLEQSLRGATNPKDKYDFLVDIAYCAAQSNDHKRAAEAYRQMMSLNPSIAENMYWVAYHQQASGNFAEALKTYNLFLARFPADKKVTDVKQAIEKLKHESRPMKFNGRWAQMPIAICLLDPDVPVKGYHENYRALVGRALKTWQDQSQGLISFDFVDKREKAKIVIYWTDKVGSLKEVTGNQSIGLTKYNKVDARGYLHEVEISLLTIDPLKNEPFKDLALESIALHEIGHALGLPHSSSPADVMFPWERNEGNTHTALSARDLSWVKYLYSYKVPGKVPGTTAGAKAAGAGKTTGAANPAATATIKGTARLKNR
jgi:tetratricopeptide (TPR) repeat protein